MTRRSLRRRGWLWLGGALILAALGWFVVQPAVRQREMRHLALSLAERGARVELTEVLGDLWDLYLAPPAWTEARDAVTDPGRLLVGGEPRVAGFSHGRVTVLPNPGYVAGYSEDLRSPVWVVYRAGGAERKVPGRRPERFLVDRRTQARVLPDEYVQSGYDRGHLAPNLAMALWHGTDAQRQSFLMSNVVPQRPAFNSGSWRRIEERIARNYPARFEEVWVVCGPVQAEPLARLRPGGVAIPAALFLIVLDETDGRWRAQAFIVPQDATGEDDAWQNYRVNIDEIERRVGFDFFADLPDAVEAPLEAGIVARRW